ncbi:hypothetical protein PQX77_010603 [Marasmius sp. AFHP31]|nr:hypothetical protein PQX77_010603 [Marasmius sp. AFHP31]
MFAQLLTAVFLLATHVQALAWTATPFNPPSIPLAVRTPYVSAWLPQGAGKALNDVWPTFWTGQILGWAGFAKVDGVAYSWLGAPSVPGASFTKATQKSFTFTATQSTFVLSAGPVDLTVNFFSPVEPNDLLRQSTPFSYLSVSAASTDGRAHSVQIYSDISAEWVSGDNGLVANWNTTTGSILTHQVQLATQSRFKEVNDHTQYGSAFYSTPNTASATFQSGGDTTVRAQFIQNGRLPNTRDTNFRAINNNWPVFALAHDLGSVTTGSVLFTVGHIRDPAIEYIVKGNTMQNRSVFFWSKYATPADLISAFISDFDGALGRAKTFDAKVKTDAGRISSDYTGIVELSIRQALAAIEITIAKNADGTWNTGDVLVFQKEISSNGNMNTVDVVFPAWPIYLYTNPTLGKYLLEAILRYQASGLYPNKWSIHDIGAHYPSANGHNDGGDEAMPVEESGNMLIMALSYVQKTGDQSHITQYRSLFEQFTQFLITDSLIPANQLSTDDFAGHLENQTNLAIKGMVGIRAMSEIEKILGDNTKAANYSSIAADYVNRFQGLGGKSKTAAHLTLQYNNDASWGLSYNLFGDKLLKLNLFPQSIYDLQTAWYANGAGVQQPFGVPLDTRHTYTKSDWEIFTAGIVTNTGVRDMFIQKVKAYLTSGKNDAPFSDWYETTNANIAGFRARPVAGGHLALLVL